MAPKTYALDTCVHAAMPAALQIIHSAPRAVLDRVLWHGAWHHACTCMALTACCVCALQLSSAYGKLGNIDANTGDPQIGWDTDQFLTDPKQALLVAEVILKQGGLAPGACRLLHPFSLQQRTVPPQQMCIQTPAVILYAS